MAHSCCLSTLPIPITTSPILVHAPPRSKPLRFRPRAPALRQEKPVQQRRPSTAKSENIIFFKGVQPRAAPGQRVNDTRPVTGVILQGSTSLAGAVPGAAMGAGGPGRALERAAGR